MIEKIEALRKEPRHVRNRYAFWIAAVITLAIAGIWSLTLPARVSDIEGTPTQAVEDQSDLPDISQTFGSFFSRAKETFSLITKQASSTETEGGDVPLRQDLDFKALIASSSEEQALKQASTSASTTASTTSASSSVSTTTEGQ